MDNNYIIEEKISLIKLLERPSMTSVKIRETVEYAGSFAEAVNLSGEELLKAGIFGFEKQVGKYDSEKKMQETESESHYLCTGSELYREKLKSVTEKGIKIKLFTECDFPAKLLNISDAPGFLFYKGDLPEAGKPSVGIIGARAASEYGKSVTLHFSGELSKSGVQIISGMAAGIDSAAGRGAVRQNGKSFALEGCGVDICYPVESFDIYERMINGNGGVISEYLPGSDPLGFRFIERNRLIAAFSDVLLVMEAREKSGSFITVDYALEQGKDVFALPGRISDPLGRGCNRLLKDGAIPLTSPEDVLEYLGVNAVGEKDAYVIDLSSLSKNEKAVYDALDSDVKHIEDISALCGIPLKTTMSLLFELEMKGLAASPSSAYYKKTEIWK